MQEAEMKVSRLSLQQTRLWSVHQGVQACRTIGQIHFERAVDAGRLYNGLQQVITDQETTRSVFRHLIGFEMPVRVAQAEAALDWQEIDLRSLHPKMQHSLKALYMEQIEQHPFYDAQVFQVHVRIFSLSEGKMHVMLWIPALRADASSLARLLGIWSQACSGEIEEQALRYADVVTWQRTLTQQEGSEGRQEYWRKLDWEQEVARLQQRQDALSPRLWHERVQEQAQQRPRQIAVVCAERRMSYEQLNQQSNQLGHWLRQQGVGKETLVGLCLERSEHLMVGLLGIAKAGGAYVLLEPEHPASRLRGLVQETNVELILTQGKIQEKLKGARGKVVSLDLIQQELAEQPVQSPVQESAGESLACVLFPSEPLDAPRAMMIHQSNVSTYVEEMCEWLGSQPGWQYALTPTLAADQSYTVILSALATGGCLHVLLSEDVVHEVIPAQEAPAPLPVERGQSLRVSLAQQRLWFLQQLEPASAAYTVSIPVQMSGNLDVPAVAKSVAEIIRRHENLRTTFQEQNGVVVQSIAPFEPGDLPVVDLAALSSQHQEQILTWLRQRAAETPFDLARGPLLRPVLLRLAAQEHYFLLRTHQIIWDGWSTEVFFREFTQLYQAFHRHQPSPLAPLLIQYADYAAWQRREVQEAEMERQLGYWKEQLEASEPLELPTDHPRPAIHTFQGAEYAFSFPAELTEQLRALGQEVGATLFMTLLASFKVLLARYSGQTDISLGTLVVHKVPQEVEALIGAFVNALVLRTDLSENPGFLQLLLRVRDMVLNAYAHQDVPFARVVEALQPEYDLSRSPFFQVLFTFQSHTRSAIDLDGSTLRLLADGHKTSLYDLSLTLTDTERGVQGIVCYNTALFHLPTIQSMMKRWRRIVEGIVADSTQRIADLPFLSSEERLRAHSAWKTTRATYPLHVSIDSLLSRQVLLHAQEPAIRCGANVLRYHELDQRVDTLARRLHRMGVGPDVLVGTYMERSVDQIVAMLAIWRAGGVYVPLDLAYPAQRFAFILLNAQVQVLITQSSLRKATPPRIPTLLCEDVWQISPDDEPDPPLAPQAHIQQRLAYVIYTAGSTGTPRGVMIQHEGMLNHLFAKIHTLHLTQQDIVVQTASVCSDSSIWQSLAILLCGGQVHICPDDVVRHPQRLWEYVQQERITLLEIVPSLLSVMLDALVLPAPELSLRYLVVTGEALPRAVCQRWIDVYPHIPLLNVYGLTECSSGVAQYQVSAESMERGEHVPIGSALANTQVYLLDDYLEPVPPGVLGHMYVGGVGVGRGYYHDPSQTASVFLPDPFGSHAGTRLYRTGDLGRSLPDGTIEFVRREDQHIKVRGHRIEPGEIEMILNRYEGIRGSIVMTWEVAGKKELVAYIVAAPGTPIARRKLRAYLAQLLPDYAVPTVMYSLAAFPLLPNGKVNRRALPEPELLGGGRIGDAPRGAIEEIVVDIWRQTLQRTHVGVHTNFFEIGGHSLQAMQIISRIRMILCVDVPVRSLFEHPTIAELAAYIESLLQGEPASTAPPLVPLSRERDVPLSFAQQRVWFLDQWEPGSAVFNLASVVRFYGAFNQTALEQSLETLVERHESLRTLFATVDGQPVQQIQSSTTFSLSCIDLAQLDPDQRIESMYKLTRQEAQRSFNLALGPLFRATLLSLTEDAHVLLITMHQIIADGWSINVFVRELKALYTAYAQDEYIQLTHLPVQYADYAVWQRQWLSGELLEAHLDYWKRQLQGIEPLTLPTDLPRPPVQTFHGAQLHWAIPATLQQQLEQLSQRTDVSLFMALLAAFQLHLSYYSGQQDIAVGTSVANRTRTETEGLIGFFANTLVMRTDLSGNPTFRQLLARVREVALEAYVHQDVPFEKVIEMLQPARDLSRSPLFQVMFILQNAPRPVHEELAGLLVQAVQSEPLTTRFDVTLLVTESGRGLFCTLEYNSDLFHASTMKRWLDHWRLLLEAIVSQSEQPVGLLALLSPAFFLQTDSLPRTPGGQVDQQKLPVPNPKHLRAPHPEDTIRSPRTPFERILEEIWQDALNLDGVSVDWNFFALGGHSLLATQLRSRIQEVCQVTLPLRSIFETSTIAEIADLIERQHHTNMSALDYWSEQLRDLDTLDLPTDVAYLSAQTAHRACYSLPLPGGLAEHVRELSQQEDVTLFMLLLTAFQVLLSRLSGQKDIAVGTPVEHALRLETGEISEFAATTLVIRADVRGTPTFRQVLRQVRQRVLEAYSHRDVLFEKIVATLQREQDLSRSPLCQAAFTFQAFSPAPPEMQIQQQHREGKSAGIGQVTPDFDLKLSMGWQEQEMRCLLDYNTDLFAASTIERWMKHWHTLLLAIVANPEGLIACLPILSEEDQASLGNSQASLLPLEAPRQWTLSRVSNVQTEVSWQAQMRPDALALACEEQQISYQEMEERANQLARVLRTCGVKPEVIVGVCLPSQSPEMIVGQLAILKAGGTCLLLDPDLSTERVTSLLTDTQVWVLLALEQQRKRFHRQSLTILSLDTQWEQIAQASRERLVQETWEQQQAYVVYTSEAPDRHEGMSIHHAALLNLVDWHRPVLAEQSQQSSTRLAALGFTSTVWEHWPALISGECLDLAGLSSPEARNIQVELQGQQMEQMSARNALPESLERAIAGVDMYILDEQQQLAPIGVWGELYIGGRSLVRGYMHRADLTSERFVPHPYSPEPGQRLYRTGELAKRQKDGSIFLHAKQA